MKAFVLILSWITLSGLLGSCKAAKEQFSYQAQGNWSGVCTTGSRQSPVNIVTGAVKTNSSLTRLEFTNSWTAQISGRFDNLGSTVEFTPASTSAAFTTFLGTYDLQQFHFHWGAGNDMGSEHTVNDAQSELEVHFVHFMRGTTDSSRGDYAAVIGVLADVVDMPISGVWSQLDVAAIQSNTSSPLNITGLVLNNLLPENRNYYYYEGSLTTPPCSEIVQWFILKERITVPAEFLNKLRMVQQPDGQPLLMNYRDVQPLNNRVVMEGSQSFNKPPVVMEGSQSFNKPVTLLLLFTVLLAKLL